ncbi:hypothetical protein C8J56DRAFT_1109862 [Mycena floridula]|nr:hypothetical protein C8J56DRAFT_1109862 [Mycena floridula]
MSDAADSFYLLPDDIVRHLFNNIGKSTDDIGPMVPLQFSVQQPLDIYQTIGKPKPLTMKQTEFLEEIFKVQNHQDLRLLLECSIKEETILRSLFATNETHKSVENYVGLVDIFNGEKSIEDLTIHHCTDLDELVMKLPAEDRRRPAQRAFIPTMNHFRDNWRMFAADSLDYLWPNRGDGKPWSNVIVAGGSVLACVMESQRKIEDFYDKSFPATDVDLFLWGLEPDEAERTALDIYRAVTKANTQGCICVRTRHAISIHAQYPRRTVQIILRLYQSPAEVLAGFDVDAACFAYDGHKVWASYRGFIAVMMRCNTVDMSRRSPSYEFRLEKYRQCGFEVYRVAEIQGLARLLLLEALMDSGFRKQYFRALSYDRAVPPGFRFYRRLQWRKQNKDKKALEYHVGAADYDAAYHIPYGPDWKLKRIRDDLRCHESRMEDRNRTQYLHSHFVFYGTMWECILGTCDTCPEPRTEKEKEMQTQYDKYCVRGRVQFLREDLGRQTISGSFHSIVDDEWRVHAYGSQSSHGGKLHSTLLPWPWFGRPSGLGLLSQTRYERLMDE